jgi:hypothetical protein
MAAPDALACREMGSALREFEAARSSRDEMRLREAAEKAWLAVVDATNYHLAREGVTVEPGVKGHAQRRKALIANEEIEVYNRYAVFREDLHGEAFYGGDLGPPGYLARRIEDARNYVVEMTGCEVA